MSWHILVATTQGLTANTTQPLCLEIHATLVLHAGVVPDPVMAQLSLQLAMVLDLLLLVRIASQEHLDYALGWCPLACSTLDLALANPQCYLASLELMADFLSSLTPSK